MKAHALRANLLAAQLAEIMPTRFLRSSDGLLEVARGWCERQRFWHGPEHLRTMASEIARQTPSGEDRDTLLLAALYHDAIYDPRSSKNEESSAELLLNHAADASAPAIRRAAQLIQDSQWLRLPESALGRVFFDLDTRQLSNACSLAERIRYEQAIFQEFQWAPWPEYQEKRRAFLADWALRFPEHRHGVGECLQILDGLKPRVAVYPGSFHPFHRGHLSILRQAEQAFDKVIVAAGVNRQKLPGSDSLQSRHSQLQDQLRFHEVVAFEGLLSEFLNGLGFPTTVVRGVRDGTDLESELRYARFLNELRPGTGVVWISCEPDLQHLSSSAIRELASIQTGAESRYLPGSAEIYELATAG